MQKIGIQGSFLKIINKTILKEGYKKLGMWVLKILQIEKQKKIYDFHYSL